MRTSRERTASASRRSIHALLTRTTSIRLDIVQVLLDVVIVVVRRRWRRLDRRRELLARRVARSPSRFRPTSRSSRRAWCDRRRVRFDFLVGSSATRIGDGSWALVVIGRRVDLVDAAGRERRLRLQLRAVVVVKAEEEAGVRGRSEREREGYIRRRGEGSIDQVGREAAGALQDADVQRQIARGGIPQRGRQQRTSFQKPSRCGVCPSEMRENSVVQC